jgi:thymidylate synthase (FAD)
MKIIKPSYEILTKINGEEILKHIELCGRVCCKSENKITNESSIKFVNNIKEKEHFAVLEHFNISVRFICDRGFSHELVRHRLASFCQESTRYCNYSKDKFGNEITVIQPIFVNNDETEKFFINDKNYAYLSVKDISYHWWRSCIKAEKSYFEMLECGATPQDARSVLPNSLKTEIIITANLREWMHIFELRCSEKAHPSMRELMIPLKEEFKKQIPILFE